MGEARIKWIHVFNLMLAVIAAVLIGVLVITGNTFRGNPAYAKADSTVTAIDDGWVVLNSDGSISEFNEFGSYIGVNEIALNRIFVFDFQERSDSISFDSNHCAVEVYQDGYLIYTFGSVEDVRNGIIPGVYHCVVPLEVYRGEASDIEVRLYSNSDIKVNHFYFGSTLDSVHESFASSVVTIIFSVSMVVVAIVIGTFAVIGRKRLKLSFEYFYFLLFVIFIAIWSISDIQVLSSIGMPAGVVSVISYESFALMLIPFMVYMYYNSKHLRVMDLGAVILLFANFITINVLHLSKVLSLARSMVSSQVLIVLCILIVACQVIVDLFKERSLNTILAGVSLAIIILGAVLQLMLFYSNREYNNSVILQVGISLFVIIHVGKLFSQIFNLIEEGLKAEDYLSLARTDPLTGLGNRRGLDLYISEIAKSPTPFYRLGCIVCDLNDLKKTNDVYGHDVGDRLIKDFANCLQVCFENRGKVFRTGGDEFYILFSDVEVDMSAMMRRLTICLDGSNSSAEYKISCSRGCYADYVAANNEDAVWDIIKFADAEMYKMKNADRAKRRAEAEKAIQK